MVVFLVSNLVASQPLRSWVGMVTLGQVHSQGYRMAGNSERHFLTIGKRVLLEPHSHFGLKDVYLRLPILCIYFMVVFIMFCSE